MNTPDKWKQNATDPLGLCELEQVEPGFDGWEQIAGVLQARHDKKRNWRRAGGWLAMAASLVLVIGITINLDTSAPETQGVATPVTSVASVQVPDNHLDNSVVSLIGLSQSMEAQVRDLRQGTGSMPAESAIYVAELEDLIAQVDSELSLTPDSVDLWGQRVNLLLDLAQIYQQQWQIDYGRMASL